MILEHIGLSQINGSLVVLDDVKGVQYDEMVELHLDDGSTRVGRVVRVDGDRCVIQVYEAVHIPIVGMGGVTSAQDVLELMLAGATAVGVGAANLVEPYACKHIIETLPDAMARFGIDDLRDIIGGAHHG